MHIVAIAWMFVVVLMTAAEATSTQGSLLGALFTFLLYGVLPLGIVLYILGTPGRKRLRRAAEAQAEAEAALAAAGQAPDGGGLDGEVVVADGATARRLADPRAGAGNADLASAGDGDGRGQPAGAAVTPKREEP